MAAAWTWPEVAWVETGISVRDGVRKLDTLRREEVDALFPGLLASVLAAAASLR